MNLPKNEEPKKSDSERLIDDMLDQLNVKDNNAKASASKQQQSRPNYNSSFFNQNQPKPQPQNQQFSSGKMSGNK